MAFSTSLLSLTTLIISTLAHPSPPPLTGPHPSLSSVPPPLTNPLNATSYCFDEPDIPGEEPTEKDCLAVIVNILTSPDASIPRQWRRESSHITRWTNNTCSITVKPARPSPEDVFRLVDVAAAASLVVRNCKCSFLAVVCLCAPKKCAFGRVSALVSP
jgi:hypothetical protein